MKKTFYKYFASGLMIIGAFGASAQINKTPTEDDYYKIISIPAPEGVLLEAGGVATLPDGRIAVSTRRGDVWTIENPTMAMHKLFRIRQLFHLRFCPSAL